MLGVSIVLACVIGSLAMLAVQGHVPLDLVPFVLVWGLLLLWVVTRVETIARVVGANALPIEWVVYPLLVCAACLVLDEWARAGRK